MPFTPTVWSDGVTPLSAANFNFMGTQYAEAMADGGIPYAVDSSTTANTIIAALSPAPSAYEDGYSARVKVANTTTGATTLNLNGLGAVAVKNADGTAVGAGDLVADVPRIFTYVAGTTPAFIAAGSGGLSASGTATTADVLTGYSFTSASGRAQSGAMPNNGSPTLQPGASIAAGYYSGGSVAAYPHGSQVFTAPGTFTVPADVTSFVAVIIGGGGASGEGNGSYWGSPGSSGEVVASQLSNVTPGASYSVSAIGAAGTGLLSGSSFGQGNSGGASTFNGDTANGGNGGITTLNNSTAYAVGSQSQTVNGVAYGAGGAPASGSGVQNSGTAGAVVILW